MRYVRIGCCGAGDVPVCSPREYYECAVESEWDYVTNNVAATCNCPRQCRHLSYKHDISQAMLSNHMLASALDTLRLNVTLDKFRIDYCLLEVMMLHAATFFYKHTHFNYKSAILYDAAAVDFNTEATTYLIRLFTFYRVMLLQRNMWSCAWRGVATPWLLSSCINFHYWKI